MTKIILYRTQYSKNSEYTIVGTAVTLKLTDDVKNSIARKEQVSDIVFFTLETDKTNFSHNTLTLDAEIQPDFLEYYQSLQVRQMASPKIDLSGLRDIINAEPHIYTRRFIECTIFTYIGYLKAKALEDYPDVKIIKNKLWLKEHAQDIKVDYYSNIKEHIYIVRVPR